MEVLSNELLIGIDPANDPELAQYGIEFAQKAMTKAPSVFLQIQPTSSLEYLFMFAIKMLNGNEPLPKAAAAEFWVSFSHFVLLPPANTGIDKLHYPESF
jgi:hypothetical protein